MYRKIYRKRKLSNDTINILNRIKYFVSMKPQYSDTKGIFQKQAKNAVRELRYDC